MIGDKECLNCGQNLVDLPGKRKKVFCNSSCRSNYWQKSDRLEKEGKSIDEIVSILSNMAKSKKVKPKKVQDLSKPNTEVKPVEQPQTNYVIDTQKISELEKELAAIPDKTKGLGKLLAKSLQDKIYNLKYGI